MIKLKHIGRRLAGLSSGLLLVAVTTGPSTAAAQTPAVQSAFGVARRTVLLSVRGVGAQIYQCKPSANGAKAWALREPIATLIGVDGQTLGRHFAGPTWEMADGSAVKGHVSATAPGAGPGDIAQLKLDIVDHKGGGVLAAATTVLRLNTLGGGLSGACETAGEFRAAPYAADYVFLR